MTDGLTLTGERTLPGIPAENYWFRRHVAAYRFAARVVRGRVVDAGSGEGYGAAILARRGRVVGIELDPAAAAHAARTYPQARFLRADLCRLPMEDSSVDAVVALQVVEHLACAGRFVAASRRALRPGGVLVVSTPNRATFPADLNPFHVREYDADELRDLLGRRFGAVRLLGVEHRRPLAALDRSLGEPIQHRLVRTPYPELPRWLRAILRTVTGGDFRITARPERALDLLGVCSR